MARRSPPPSPLLPLRNTPRNTPRRCRKTARALRRGALWTGTAGAVGLLAAAARARPARPDQRPPEPPAGLPPGRVEHVPGHGEFMVRDTGHPGPDSVGGADPPTILLLHGWMFPSDLNWFTCYEPLGAVGRVIAADLRGHGRGPRPATPFRLSDAADDAAALLRHLGTGPAIVVGYSMGGTVAQLLWRRHPDLVRGLVLCATSATFSASARSRWIWRGMGALQLGLRVLPRHWIEALVHRQADGRLPIRLSRLINEDTPPELLERLPWFLGELSRGSAEDLAEAGREMGRYDARGWLGGLDVPSCVVVTKRDVLVPRTNQRALAALIPACTVLEVDLDHDGVAAHPAVFVPALLKAVEQVASASAPPA